MFRKDLYHLHIFFCIFPLVKALGSVYDVKSLFRYQYLKVILGDNNNMFKVGIISIQFHPPNIPFMNTRQYSVVSNFPCELCF